MPELKTVSKPKVSNRRSTYTELLRQVRETLARGRERAADAVEREKVRTCWETGKLIQEHILLNQSRAQYGAEVLKRLSSDLGMSESELGFMVQFARAYPISSPARKLSWSHYRELLSINDDDKREEITEKAVKGNWTREDLRQEIRKRRTAKEITLNQFPASAPLEAKRGTLYTYKIVLAKLGPLKGKPVIDLGFSNYFRPSGKFNFKEGDIIHAENGLFENARSFDIQSGRVGQNSPDSTRATEPGYTYRVYVDEVTDGDTIWVLIDLGFGVFTKQQLRLRGLDCPEIATRDGQVAKKFVERQLLSSRSPSPLSFPHVLGGNPRRRSPIKTFGDDIVITSTKSDKYDRYLADIWVGESYLNQKLIDKSLAVQVSE